MSKWKTLAKAERDEKKGKIVTPPTVQRVEGKAINVYLVENMTARQQLTKDFNNQ